MLKLKCLRLGNDVRFLYSGEFNGPFKTSEGLFPAVFKEAIEYAQMQAVPPIVLEFDTCFPYVPEVTSYFKNLSEARGAELPPVEFLTNQARTNNAGKRARFAI